MALNQPLTALPWPHSSIPAEFGILGFLKRVKLLSSYDANCIIFVSSGSIIIYLFLKTLIRVFKFVDVLNSEKFVNFIFAGRQHSLLCRALY